MDEPSPLLAAALGFLSFLSTPHGRGRRAASKPAEKGLNAVLSSSSDEEMFNPDQTLQSSHPPTANVDKLRLLILSGNCLFESWPCEYLEKYDKFVAD